MGNGKATEFWKDSWIPRLPEAEVFSPPPPNCQWTKVADFIESTSHTWDLAKLSSCVSRNLVSILLLVLIRLNWVFPGLWGSGKGETHGTFNLVILGYFTTAPKVRHLLGKWHATGWLAKQICFVENVLWSLMFYMWEGERNCRAHSVSMSSMDPGSLVG